MIIPSFHERNRILLDEAKVLLDNPRTMVGRSVASGTVFYGLGGFYSEFLDDEVYGGIKK